MGPKDKWVRTSAIRDQAWADLRQYKEDLERIIQSGPQSKEDITIIQKALLIVLGDLSYNEGQAQMDSN